MKRADMEKKISSVLRVVRHEVFITRRVVKHQIFSTRVEHFTHIDIETTTYCNRRCSYCPNSVFERGLRKNKHLMAPVLFRKIVDELVDIGFKGILCPFLYGEPLTDSRLISFMQYAHARLPGSQLAIFTNGDFLTPTLLEQLYAAGVRDYSITLHSTDDKSLTDSVNRVMQLRKHAKDQNMDISLPYQARIGEGQLDNRGGLVEVDKLGRSPRVYRGMTQSRSTTVGTYLSAVMTILAKSFLATYATNSRRHLGET